jgi:hypothetical protein
MTDFSVLPASASSRLQRLQHLYALDRILGAEPQPARAFRLEGDDRVDVLDARGELLDSVQIAAVDVALLPAHLGTHDGEAFFRRALTRLEGAPIATQTIASFGPVGALLRGDGERHDALAAQLSRAGFAKKRIETLLEALRVIEVNEASLRAHVVEQLDALRTDERAVDAQLALPFLDAWLEGAAARRQIITAADLRERIVAIDRFMRDFSTHRAEWTSFLQPLDIVQKDDDANAAQLHAQLARGVIARNEHILIGSDVARPRVLDAIDAAFAHSTVAVLHGEPGSGAHAAAFRWLLDRAPSGWRFELQSANDVRSAARVALALGVHARAIGIPLLLWYDAAPRELEWLRLADALRATDGVQLLVTTGESAWNRAKHAGAHVLLRDVPVTLSDEERHTIALKLASRNGLPIPNDVQNISALELTHLVTQQKRLQETIAETIESMRAELSETELALLGNAALATSYGARVRIDRLTHITAIDTLLTRFEDAQLLRREGDLIAAVHPLRSRAIVEHLGVDHDRAARLADTLAYVEDSDIESLLLHAAQEWTAEAFERCVAAFAPQSWRAAAGVLRATIWNDLRRYVDSNEALLRVLSASMGRNEMQWIALDPVEHAAAAPGLQALLDEVFAMSGKSEVLETIRSARPAGYALEGTRRWLASLQLDAAPSGLLDWSGAAEILFWCGVWKLTPPSITRFGEAISQIETMPVDAAADFVFAASFCGDALDANALAAITAAADDRFRRELRVIAIDDDGLTATVHYLMPIDDGEGRSAIGGAADESNARLLLMRRLRPAHVAFGARGYGHPFGTELFPNDPTVREHIPAESFPPPWSLRAHREFVQLTARRYRDDDFSTYAQSITSLRRQVVEAARGITSALAKYFRKDKAFTIFDAGISQDFLGEIVTASEQLPELPRATVDEWGNPVSSDDDANPHADLVTAIRTHAEHLRAFLMSSLPFFVTNASIGRGDVMTRERAKQMRANVNPQPPVATKLLAELIENLPALQRELRARFGQLYEAAASEQLDRDELDALRTLWSMWYAFAQAPERRIGDAARELPQELDARIDARRRKLRQNLRKLAPLVTAEIMAEIMAERDADPGRGLWLSMDVSHNDDVFDALLRVLAVAADALHPPADEDALDRHALDFAWTWLHIVPLVNGRSVQGTEWRFLISAFPSDGSSPLREISQLLPYAIEPELASQLGLARWSRAAVGAPQTLESAAGIAATRLEMLTRLDEPFRLSDEFGQDRLRIWVAAAIRSIVTRLGEASDALRAIAGDANDERTEQVAGVYAALSHLLQSVAPDDFESIREASSAMSKLQPVMRELSAKALDATVATARLDN